MTMRDKYNRERCLMVYYTVKNRTIKNALTLKEIAEIIQARLGLHQDTFDRRAIANDLKSMVEIGMPIVVGRGPNNRILAWGKQNEMGQMYAE